MSPLRIRLSRVVSNTGDTVDVADPGLTCVVGSNNVGKSLILRECMARMSTMPGQQAVTRAVAEAVLTRDPANLLVHDVEALVQSNGIPAGTTGSLEPQYSPPLGGTTMTVATTHGQLVQDPNALGGAIGYFAWLASAGSLVAQASGSMGTPGMAPDASPLGRLFREGVLEGELSQLALTNFETSLTLDRVNGNVHLRVGSVDVPIPPINQPTLEYAQAVAALPPLSDQGDGVKSFLGLALMVIAARVPIMFIDEPEAFLHPAQARALGRWLAEQAQVRDMQLIVATHDRDFLLGALGAGEQCRVTVVRVAREGDHTHLRQLPPDDLRAVWSDPVLRYSNVLQGLFHRQVTVCEADADCRFYGAVLDELAIERGQRARADDTLFVPSGGKSRVATLCEALTRLGVKATCIVDFDVLDKRDTIKQILVAVGGTWTDEMDQDYVAMTGPLNQATLWQHVKTQGLAAVPAGKANTAAQSLVETLRTQGILIVPVGELESFDRTIGVEGAAWVSAMLECDGHKTCAAARDLVGNLLEGW
ncbi:MAG: hypothetical protein QOG53_3215 [Frankiales bacterium]|jgi:hypothetical protein|nr:hypothetical protein [Frankiales bacterium]